MKTTLITTFILCTFLTCVAQTTTYYNAKNKVVKTLAKAEYYSVLVEDSAKEFRNLERQYNKAGQILSEQRYFWKDYKTKLFDGLCRKWYENGQLQMEVSYVDGKKDGFQIRYKEDGTMIQKVEYPYEKFQTSQLNGIEILQTAEQMPEFPGGEIELVKFISSKLKYPFRAKEDNIQGIVLVRFAVMVTGELIGADVIRSSNNDELDEEALRVVSLLPNFTPGNQNGNVVAVYFVIPIKFTLRQ